MCDWVSMWRVDLREASIKEAALTEPLNLGLSPTYEVGIKAAGVAPDIITEGIQSRLEKATELGADYALNVDDGDVCEQILGITEAGADAILIYFRWADALHQSTQAVRREAQLPSSVSLGR